MKKMRRIAAVAALPVVLATGCQGNVPSWLLSCSITLGEVANPTFSFGPVNVVCTETPTLP